MTAPGPWPPVTLAEVLRSTLEDGVDDDTARAVVTILDLDRQVHCAAHEDGEDGCPVCVEVLDAAAARVCAFLELRAEDFPTDDAVRGFIILGQLPGGPR